MADNGGNLAPTAPTLAYIIENPGDGPTVEWFHEPVAITVDQALTAQAEAALDPERSRERSEAERWLREVLSAGPVPSKEIEASVKGAGFSIATLRRAKQSIGVESVRDGFGKDSICSWRLPDASNH
jgi:putative DNA primase/helicase